MIWSGVFYSKPRHFLRMASLALLVDWLCPSLRSRPFALVTTLLSGSLHPRASDEYVSSAGFVQVAALYSGSPHPRASRQTCISSRFRGVRTTTFGIAPCLSLRSRWSRHQVRVFTLEDNELLEDSRLNDFFASCSHNKFAFSFQNNDFFKETQLYDLILSISRDTFAPSL